MIDFFSKLYSSIENKNAFLSKVKFYGAQRAIVKFLANLFIPIYLKLTNHNNHRLKVDGKSNLIVSLTTFPVRIGKIWIVIECMLRQTYKPDKIILWLSKEQFKSLNQLPKRLLKLRERGLEINLCDGDLRSYKKYIYTLEEFPDSHFITVDDDFIYPSSLIEELMSAHKKKKDHIICHRAHMMTKVNGALAPYHNWIKEYKGASTSNQIFFTSGGGTLFPPKSLGEEASNAAVFMNKCKLADDVWLNAMSNLNNTSITKIDSKYKVNIPITIMSNVTLASSNVDKDLNDIQIKAVRDHYWNTLKHDVFKI